MNITLNFANGWQVSIIQDGAEGFVEAMVRPQALDVRNSTAYHEKTCCLSGDSLAPFLAAVRRRKPCQHILLAWQKPSFLVMKSATVNGGDIYTINNITCGNINRVFELHHQAACESSRVTLRRFNTVHGAVRAATKHANCVTK